MVRYLAWAWVVSQVIYNLLIGTDWLQLDEYIRKGNSLQHQPFTCVVLDRNEVAFLSSHQSTS